MGNKIGINGGDILVILGYMLLLIIVVRRTRVKQSSTVDYYLGGRGIPFWAAGLSLLVTALSAATFIGLPTSSYNGNLTFMATNIGTVLGVVLVAFLFLPKFYRAGVQSIYSYLEQKFGQQTAMLASWVFLIGRVMASGARLFIAAIAVVYIVTPVWGGYAYAEVLAIIGMLCIGLSYSYGGGIRTVIWTDVAQAGILIVAGVGVFLWLWHLIPLNLSEVMALLREPTHGAASKMTIIDPGFTDFDPSLPYTLAAILFGQTLLIMGAYGTDQDMAQRMLTCNTPKNAAKSALFCVIVNLPISFMFLTIGLLLYIFYEHSYLFAMSVDYEVDTEARVFAQFIAYETPHGLRGLLLVGIIAAAVSGLSSELNSLSSSFVNNTYRIFKPQCQEKHYLKVGRIATIGAAMALGVFAALCIYLHRASGETLIDFIFLVMVYAYSGLLAVFITALFTRRGNRWSTTLGLLSGFILVTYMQWFSNIGTYLAFPWQMLIATLAALTICCLGRR